MPIPSIRHEHNLEDIAKPFKSLCFLTLTLPMQRLPTTRKATDVPRETTSSGVSFTCACYLQQSYTAYLGRHTQWHVGNNLAHHLILSNLTAEGDIINLLLTTSGLASS